ncbi:MAG TPA: glycosyltransferase [Jiangellales bacterium]|nr:glycosyltransferase [Jiangellales bacterium]
MRVCMLVEPADRAAGHVRGLAAALAAHGHDVTRVERRTDPQAPARDESGPGRVPVVRLDAGPPRPLTADERLRAAPELGYRLAVDWATSRPDVVHAHGWQAGLAALAAARDLPSSLRPLVILTFHGLVAGRRHHTRSGAAPGVPDPRRAAVRPRLEAALARGVDRIVALSNEELERLVALGVSRQDVQVVPTGVEPTVFQPEPRPEHHGGPVRLLAAGSLAPSGCLDLAVRALAGVKGAELVLLPAGSVEATDTARLVGTARRHGVADRLHVLDPVPPAALPGVLRSADVLVRTRPDEPTGRLVVQAMACGLPVVGPAVGCLLDAVVEGGTGVLVPPEDSRALATALHALVSDPVRREGYGLAAVERARTRYAWPRLAEEVERAYGRAELRRSGSGGAGVAHPGAAAAPAPTGS